MEVYPMSSPEHETSFLNMLTKKKHWILGLKGSKIYLFEGVAA
jgi:hypothetical protein